MILLFEEQLQSDTSEGNNCTRTVQSGIPREIMRLGSGLRK